MIRRGAFVLFLAVALSVTASAQNAEPTQQDEPAAIAQDTSVQNNTQGGTTQKTENPPEPESHGTRLRWQDIPKNVLHDEKAFFTAPFHLSREDAKWWAIFGGATAVLI